MKEHLENTDSVKYKALELCDSTDSEETKIAKPFPLCQENEKLKKNHRFR